MTTSTPDNSGVNPAPASTPTASPTQGTPPPAAGPPGGGTVSGGTAGGGAVSDSVDKTRSITGLLAVVAGDVVIAVAAILGILHISSSSTQSAQFVAILTSAFTAIGTMTTAYFGIKSISNTAQALGQNSPGGPAPTPTAGTPSK
jgi:hypothetical protein